MLFSCLCARGQQWSRIWCKLEFDDEKQKQTSGSWKLAVFVQCRDIAKDEEKENGEKDTESAKERLAELQSSLESKRAEVATWCHTSYGEAFSAWVHICAVRLFVESVLRYGLPPQFLGALIEPGARTEAKVRKALAAEFGGAGAQFWSAEEGSAATDAKEYYPYVSFTLDIDV